MDLADKIAKLAVADSPPTAPIGETVDLVKSVSAFCREHFIKRAIRRLLCRPFLSCLQTCQNAGDTSDDDEPAECTESDSSELAIDQPQPLTLWTLPDLCLITLFQQCDLQQLHTMANVCKRFRQIAVSASRSRYSDRYMCDIECLDRAIFMSCLRTFSPSNVRISLDCNDKIFDAIAKYCHNLNALSIRREVTRPHELAAVRRLLPKLRSMTVQQMDFWRGDADTAGPLESLFVYEDLPIIWPPRLKLPKLKRLQICMTGISLTDPLCFDFMATNDHIQQLELYKCGLFANGLRALPKCLPNVRSLTFFGVYIGNDGVQPSGVDFRCLENVAVWSCVDEEILLRWLIGTGVRHLDLIASGIIAASVLRRLSSVRKLTLHLATVDEVLRYTYAMSGLRKLHLHVSAYFHLSCVKRLIVESHRLTKLHIQWHQKQAFDSGTEFDEIAALIAARPQLRVVLQVRRQLFKVPDFVWRRHARWLKGIDCPEYTHRARCDGYNCDESDDDE